MDADKEVFYQLKDYSISDEDYDLTHWGTYGNMSSEQQDDVKEYLVKTLRVVVMIGLHSTE